MKKLIPFMAAILLLAGCGNNSNQTPNPPGTTNSTGNGASNAPEIMPGAGTNGMSNGTPTVPQTPGH